jgi:hypothetical protein
MTPKKVNADTLKSTQSQLVGTKVAGMAKALEADPNHPAITAPIFVSKDGYVLDGHHRWAAQVGAGILGDKPVTMNVIEVDMPIDKLVNYSNEFATKFGIAQKAGKVKESVNESDMTRHYDGFKILDMTTKDVYKFRYVKGIRNTRVELEAISKLSKKTGRPQSNFGVTGFVKKGTWATDSTDKFTESKTQKNDITELTTSNVSGTKAGWVDNLERKKYELKKEIVATSGTMTVKLPKGTIIYNLPGGVFAKHTELEKYAHIPGYTSKFGLQITKKSETLTNIEKNSKILESKTQKNANTSDVKNEYESLKKASINWLRSEWSRNQRVGNPKELDKNGLISDLLRWKFGNKPVAQAFGLKESLTENIKRKYPNALNSLTEGTWQKIMQGVRKNPQGPFSVVAIKDKKVVGQTNDIKIPDLIPAKYEDMKRKYPDARISIENGEGTQVYFESVTEATYGQAMSTKDVDGWIKLYIKTNYPNEYYPGGRTGILGKPGYGLTKSNIMLITKLAKKNNDKDLLKLVDRWTTIAKENGILESVNEGTITITAFGETEKLNVKLYKDKTGHSYVSLYTSDGEPYADITVVLPETKDLPKDEFFVKGWSENKDIVAQLIKNKVLIPTGKKASSGYVEAHSFKLNSKYK